MNYREKRELFQLPSQFVSNWI